MELSAVLFLVLGFAFMVISFIMEGGHLNALFVPTAAIIVFGGTIGAVGLSFPFEVVKKVPAMFKCAFLKRKTSKIDTILFLKDMVIKSRKNGIISLQSEVAERPDLDPFIQNGLLFVCDGMSSEVLKSILESELEVMSSRHKKGIELFEAAGGFAPTMGIIGTVMGLVHVLGNLDDPSSMGPKIAVAFIATLYGVASANLLWLPIASKLKVLNKEEVEEKLMIIEGIVSISEGDSSSITVEKLKVFLNESEKSKLLDSSKKDSLPETLSETLS
jgi:chemotaxis protein MotA